MRLKIIPIENLWAIFGPFEKKQKKLDISRFFHIIIVIIIVIIMSIILSLDDEDSTLYLVLRLRGGLLVLTGFLLLCPI